MDCIDTVIPISSISSFTGLNDSILDHSKFLKDASNVKDVNGSRSKEE